MKKLILFQLRFSLAVAAFITISGTSPMIAASQANKYKVYAHCCTCYSMFFYRYDDRIGGTCFLPECKILCPDCRKKLGDLNAALERLKGKNRGLKEAYDAFEAQYARALENYNAAMERTFGKEAGGVPSTWDYISLMTPTGFVQPWGRGYSGLKGSFGSWFAAQLSLESSFAAPEYKELLTLVTNGVSIYQSGFTATPDGAMTWAGIYCDYIGGNEFINTLLYHKEIKEALSVFLRQVDEGTPLDIATANYNSTVAKSFEDLQFKPKASETAGIILDVIGLILATKTLITDVWDIIDNYQEGKLAAKQLKPITDSILKNDSAITCIRRTIDYINNGGVGILKNQESPFFVISALGTIIDYQAPEFSSWNIKQRPASIYEENPTWQINEFKMESAFNKLKKLEKVQQQMREIIKKQFYPNVIPWGTKKWKEVKPSVLLQMLRKTKAALPPLSLEYKKIKPLAESVFEDLMTAITGCEIDYFAASAPDGVVTTVNNGDTENNDVQQKWNNTVNEKIKNEAGRLNLIFPGDVDWSVDIYTAENKFYTNRSSYSKHTSYDLAPGNYNFRLNTIPIDNVIIEKGKETKLKTGILNIVSRERWEIYDQTKKKILYFRQQAR